MENKCFFGWSRKKEYVHVPHLLDFHQVEDIVECVFTHTDKTEADLAEIFQTTHKEGRVWITFIPEKLGETAYSFLGVPISISVFDQDKTMYLRLKVSRTSNSHTLSPPKQRLRRMGKRFLESRK